MSPSEQLFILREEWCYVLGIQSAEPSQNFFALGGDSLDALELITRVAKRAQWEMRVEIVFLDGTLEGLERSLQNSTGVA